MSRGRFLLVVVEQTLDIGNILPVAVRQDDTVRRKEVGRGVTEDGADDGHPHQEEDRVDALSALQPLPISSSRDAHLAGVGRRDAEMVHHVGPPGEEYILKLVLHGFCKTLWHIYHLNTTSVSLHYYLIITSICSSHSDSHTQTVNTVHIATARVPRQIQLDFIVFMNRRRNTTEQPPRTYCLAARPPSPTVRTNFNAPCQILRQTARCQKSLCV